MLAVPGCVYGRDRKKIEEHSMKLEGSSSERVCLLSLDVPPFCWVVVHRSRAFWGSKTFMRLDFSIWVRRLLLFLLVFPPKLVEERMGKGAGQKVIYFQQPVHMGLP
ncbi:unnamed protein product [Prunus armeniaca]